ncbi:hypothetical protein SEA_PHONEGINGI_3 [Microbacterium phage Phonegingi]|nr:hypothetical protein SEA_PHONEGINGI_3 [Microbacterium phage Phonegingi]
MSQATSDALDAAVRAHVEDETGGDIVVGWALTAGIVMNDMQGKTAWITTRDLARYEVRGLLGDGMVLIDQVGKG